MIAIGIGVESLVRLFQPTTVAFTEATIIAAIGLAVNVVSAFLLAGSHSHDHGHGHSHGHHAQPHGHGHEQHAHGDDHAHPVAGLRSQDNNLRAAYIHVLADALTSVLAIVALLSGRFLGWVWLDPVMGWSAPS